MNNPTIRHSAGWVVFTNATFALSLLMVAAGVLYKPIDNWMKGFLGMATVLLVQSCVTLTNTIRDQNEAEKLVNRIEDAKAEKLLMDVGRA